MTDKSHLSAGKSDGTVDFAVPTTAAERKAAYSWLVRRDAAFTSEDEFSFQRWLLDSPRNAIAYAEAEKLWGLMQIPASRLVIVPRDRPWGFPSFIPKAAGVLIAVCVAVFFVLSANGDFRLLQNWRADVVTAQGEKKPYDLPDGSSVVLGADTALELNFSDPDQRIVKILRGQAFFRVRPDHEKSFRVDAGQSHVMVTGTAFDVSKQSDFVSVAVEHGSVLISGDQSTASVALAPDEKIVVLNGIPGAVEKVDADLELSWMKGHVSFHKQRFGTVTDTLQRYMKKSVFIRGNISDRIVSGSFPTENPEEALQSLVQAIGARSVSITPWAIVIY